MVSDRFVAGISQRLGAGTAQEMICVRTVGDFRQVSFSRSLIFTFEPTVTRF
jgi:hypothetical protein